MDYTNQANQANQAVKAENPLHGLLRDYVQAKEQFDAACHDYQRAVQGRDEAERSLQALSEKVTAVVQQGIYDPTTPQPGVTASNGGVSGLLVGQTAMGQAKTQRY